MAAAGIIAATTAATANRLTLIDISLETLDIFYAASGSSRKSIATNRKRFVALRERLAFGVEQCGSSDEGNFAKWAFKVGVKLADTLHAAIAHHRGHLTAPLSFRQPEIMRICTRSP